MSEKPVPIISEPEENTVKKELLSQTEKLAANVSALGLLLDKFKTQSPQDRLKLLKQLFDK